MYLKVLLCVGMLTVSLPAFAKESTYRKDAKAIVSAISKLERDLPEGFLDKRFPGVTKKITYRELLESQKAIVSVTALHAEADKD